MFKATSMTTRLHCVFDGSAKSSTGVSLNEHLLAGPTLHPRLTTILSRFRLHAIAISSDISKMFRGIHLLLEEKNLYCTDTWSGFMKEISRIGVCGASPLVSPLRPSWQPASSSKLPLTCLKLTLWPLV